MKNSIKLFTINHTSIYLHWSFGLLIALMLFIQSATGTAASEVLWSVIAVTAVFACVIFHELCHSLAAGRYGIHTKSITLLPIGGIAAMEKMPEKPAAEIVVSAAGPMGNLLIAVALLPFIPGYPPFWKAADVIGSVDSYNFLYYLYVVNIMLALFNLIPAFPMDGGRILKGILGLRMDPTRSTAIAAFTGRIIAALFIIGGLIVFDIILMFIGFFIIVSGAGEEKIVYLKAAAKGLYLKDLAIDTASSFPATTTIEEAAEKMLHYQDKCFLVTDNTTTAGIIDRNTILRALSGGKHEATISQFMTADVPTLNEECTMEEAIDKLSGNKVTAMPVVTGNRIMGIVNMQNIIEYLAVHDIQLREHSHSGAMYKFLRAS